MLNGKAEVKAVIVSSLNEKILNPAEAFRGYQRSGIVELECIMKLPPGAYEQGELLGTVKPAPLHTVRMNCITRTDTIYTINIYSKTGSMQFNSTQVDISSDMFFIGQATYVAEE